MTYSIRTRYGETSVGPDGSGVAEVMVRVFWDGVPIGKPLVHKRAIGPKDDITSDTSRLAKLIDAARKAGNDETAVSVVSR